MKTKFHIPMYDMVNCMSNSIDMVSPALSNHNKKVAATAALIMEELGYDQNKVIRIIIAGSLHDIGALSLKERLNLMAFEVNDVQKHAELGYRHVKSFSPLSEISPIIRYHHYNLRQLEEADVTRETAFESGVLHLADRISILIKNDSDIISQSGFISQLIRPASGNLFYPEAVDAFLSASGKESFWFTITGNHIDQYLESRMKQWKAYLDIDHLYEFAKLFGRVIDFRSSFTAIHSNRVSRISTALAHHAGMSDENCRLIGIAGLLHDLGKLAVSAEILEKPSPLSDSEWNIMRRHSFYTYELLSGIEGFETITRLASNHHERLNGNGYPFHYRGSEISRGERIVAVSDIFTALTENRPYRAGLSTGESLLIMKKMVKQNALDGFIVDKLSANVDQLNQIRIETENEIAAEYQEFIRDI